MSESLLGVSVAATRQNSGRSANALPRPCPRRPPSGGENFPGGTTSARVTVASLKATFDKLSHVAPNTGVAAVAATTRTDTTHLDGTAFIEALLTFALFSAGRHGCRRACAESTSLLTATRRFCQIQSIPSVANLQPCR